MKIVPLIILALFIAAASPARAVDTFLKATVSGTVQTQILITGTDTRIRTATLNNKRIFREFLVAPTDYELVVNVSNSSELLLMPKHTGAMLPTFSLMKLGLNNQAVLDTKARLLVLVADIVPGVATNLFKDIAGEAAGTAHFRSPLSDNKISKFNLRVTAHGTDPAGVSTSAALLKFNVTTGSVFTQAP